MCEIVCVCGYAVTLTRHQNFWRVLAPSPSRYSPLLECLHVISSCSLTNTFLILGREKKVIIKRQLFLYLHLTGVCNNVQPLLPTFILFSLPYPRFCLQADIIPRLISSNGTFSLNRLQTERGHPPHRLSEHECNNNTRRWRVPTKKRVFPQEKPSSINLGECFILHGRG